MKRVSCDVLVIGAGVAGVAAALAAARQGAKTILVEKEAYLGGIGYAGMLRHICGLYVNADTVPTETINKGISRELAARLTHATPEQAIRKMGAVYVLAFSSHDLEATLTSLCSAEKNLTVLRQCEAQAVHTVPGSVVELRIAYQDEEELVLPNMVIDCTGDGTISAMAGALFELTPPEKRQLAGITVHIKGIQNTDDALAIKIPYYLAQAVQQGLFSPAVRFTTFTPGKSDDEGYCKLSIAATGETNQDKQAMHEADEVVRYLAETIPALENAYISAVSHKVLEREGRRIRGEYTLTSEDVLTARKFPDGVVKNAWPIELWDPLKGTSYHAVPRGDYYEIPFRCLMVKGFSNLLTAGRCISVTHEALGSTRVMGACMALGEQAGKAAAYHVKHGKYPENMKE